jgi:hypothetical protein
VKVGGLPKDSVSHGCEKKSGEECQTIKEHINSSNNISKPLSTCLEWKIGRTPLLVVDGNNHLSKQFLTLFYK